MQRCPKPLNAGVLDRGLTVAEGYDYEIIEKMNRPHDDLSILVTLKANGTVEKSVTGSIMESLALDSHDDAQFSRLKEIFAKDSLQMCTFTITEKGYNLNTPRKLHGCRCRRYEKRTGKTRELHW